MDTRTRSRCGVGVAWLLLTTALGCSGSEQAPPTATEAPGEGVAPQTESPTDSPATGDTPDTEGSSAAEAQPAPAPPLTELSAAPAPADHGAWVDLLHTVRTTVASTAFRDDVAQLQRMYDGDLLTAWNSATLPAGDDTPRSVYVRIPAGARVHAIELTAGFTKVRPQGDLFTQNLRIRRLRVRHPGGEVLVTLDPEERGLQRIPVEGASGDWQLELLEWVPGTNANWRELVISELRVWGEADASTPRASSPTAVVGALPAATLTAETAAGESAQPLGEDDDAVADTAAAGPVLAQRDGLQLTRLELAPEMDGRTPLDPRTTYSKTEDDTVFCYFELANPERVEGAVSVAWEDANGHSRSAPTELRVPPNRRFVNYRQSSVGWRRPGTYSCVVREGAEELGRISFTVTD